MTELLLRVHDKVNERDAWLHQRLTKRGDMIVVVPDGWTWGSGELTNPAWRIIVSDLPETEAIGYLAEEELSDEYAIRDRVWKRKIMQFRIDRATGDLASWLADDTRRVPKWYMSATDLRRFMERKPPGPPKPMISGDGFIVRGNR